MKKLPVIALCLLAVCQLHAQPFNTKLSGMLQDTLNAYVAQISNIKGMTVGVFIPGQGIWTGSTGVSYAGQPVTVGMRMGIASNTKLFVSTVMLLLAERKILSLNDPLSKWLPSYPNINPNITIRQLLNHTSGIPDVVFVSPWIDTVNAHPTRVFTPEEVLSWVGSPLFAPGASWSYSNTNYIIAGMIAQKATGYHISRLIRDSILTPLAMDSTFYDVSEPASGTLAHRWWNSIDYNDTSRVGLNTAGGCAGALFSTPSEMVQWYTALFSGRILNAASMKDLTTFIATGSQTYQYGLGLSRETTQNLTYWGHGGSTWGYRSKVIYDSCLNVSVCGLTNCYPSGMEGVTFLLYRVIKNHVPGCCQPVSGIKTVCEGTGSVTYSVPPITNATSYSWTLPPGASGTSSTNSIIVNFGPGATSGYVVVSGVNSYGPGGSASMWVTVNPVRSTMLTASICSGESYLFKGVQRTQSGVYRDTLQTFAGCDSIVELTLSVIPTSTSTLNAEICDGESYLFDGVNRTVSGVYHDTLTNSQGCDSIVNLNLTVKPIPPTPMISRNGTTLISSAPSGNQWYNSRGIINGATGSTYTITTSDRYYCIVTVSGCSSDTSNIIDAIISGVQITGTVRDCIVYPNPASDYLLWNGECGNGRELSLRVYDVTGVLVQSGTYYNTPQRLNVADLASGVYTIEIISGKERSRQIVVIQK